MKELSRETFSSGQLPAGWYSDATTNRFDGQTWRANPATGVILPIPGDGWKKIRVEVEVAGATWIHCAWDAVLAMSLGKCPQALFYAHVLKQDPQPVPVGRLLTFDFDSQTMSAACDGKAVLHSEHPPIPVFVGGIHLALRGDCVVHSVRVLADEPKPFLKISQPVTAPWLEVMVDFADDLIRAPFRAETFAALFAEFKSWGVKRVHWLHTGMKDEGLWDGIQNAAQTHANVGEIFPAAVRAAHRQGLEIYGMLKPFDMGFGITEPTGRCPRIGGAVNWITHFAAQNRQWEMQRKPGTWGAALNDVWTRIETPVDVDLWVSDDNATYRPSTGDIRENFVAIVPRGGPVVRRLQDLVRIFGPRGEEKNFTFGLMPRGGGPFELKGFEFDHHPATPAANFGGGYDVVREPWVFAGPLGLARGKARGPLAAFSPAFPEVRHWWLGWIRDILEAGADGVEIRAMNHGYELAWNEYGFEQPIRDEFLRRHGVDFWATDDFDRAAHIRLKGEYYTQFLREAKALTRRSGKALGLHVENDLLPEEGPPMHIHFDWPTWIAEGLPDSITAKSIWPGSRFARKLLNRAHAKSIPVVFTPYCVNYWTRYDGSNPKTGGERSVDGLMDWGFREGYDAFQFYESACVVAATPDGGIKMLEPALRDVFQKHMKGRCHAKSS